MDVSENTGTPRSSILIILFMVSEILRSPVEVGSLAHSQRENGLRMENGLVNQKGDEAI